MSEKMGWLKDRIKDKGLRIKKSLRKVQPRVKKWSLGAFSLLLVLALVFGLNVRNPVPTAGLPAAALAEAGQSFSYSLDD